MPELMQACVRQWFVAHAFDLRRFKEAPQSKHCESSTEIPAEINADKWPAEKRIHGEQSYSLVVQLVATPFDGEFVIRIKLSSWLDGGSAVSMEGQNLSESQLKR